MCDHVAVPVRPPGVGRSTDRSAFPFPPVAPLLVAAVCLALSACAPFGGGGSSPDEERERPKHVTIRVENLNWATIHVYVRGEGTSRQSLGQVTSHNEATYRVRVAQLGPRHELRLIAEPVGERGAFVSDGILFEPGDTITWTIQQPIIHSRVMVQ